MVGGVLSSIEMSLARRAVLRIVLPICIALVGACEADLELPPSDRFQCSSPGVCSSDDAGPRADLGPTQSIDAGQGPIDTGEGPVDTGAGPIDAGPLIPVGGDCQLSTGPTPKCVDGALCVTDPATGSAICRSYAATTVPKMFIDACRTGMHVTDLVNFTPGQDPRTRGHSRNPLPLPFPFTFFGTVEQSVYVDTNGYITLGDPNTPSDNTTSGLPDAYQGPMIAPFETGLSLGPSPASDICVASFGNQYVIEWSQAHFALDSPITSTLTFEAILTSVNTIDFVYDTFDCATSCSSFDGSTAMFGIQSAHGAAAIRYPDVVTTSTAIRFTPVPR
jgi:hypothetical protein